MDSHYKLLYEGLDEESCRLNAAKPLAYRFQALWVPRREMERSPSKPIVGKRELHCERPMCASRRPITEYDRGLVDEILRESNSLAPKV